MFEQPWNAFSSMLFTKLGIETDNKPVHPWYLEVIDYQLFAVNTVEK